MWWYKGAVDKGGRRGVAGRREEDEKTAIALHRPRNYRHELKEEESEEGNRRFRTDLTDTYSEEL